MAVKWAPSWFQKDEEEGKKEEKKELPPELEERFSKLAEGTSKIEERLKGLDSLTAFVEDYKKDKEEERKKKETPPKKDDSSDEDLAALLLSDPKKAVGEMTAGLSTAILQTRADNIRRQVFEDNASEYEYYTGDIKKKVDALIGEQSLKFQNDPAAVANAYHTVVGKMFKEIQEGKIKSRFATPSGSGTISDKGKKNEDMEIEITPDMIKAARNSGMEIEDFRKLVKKAALAGELEVV